MKEVKCPSGAILKIEPAPFADSKALYQAIVRQAQGIEMNSKTDFASMVKNVFCAAVASPEVEKELWNCMKRCLYNAGKGDLKIDDKTFEPIEAREDYMQVCIEVVKENCYPFVKSLYAEFQKAIEMMGSLTPA